MLHVVCNPVLGVVKNILIASYFVIVHGSKDSIFESIGTIM